MTRARVSATVLAAAVIAALAGGPARAMPVVTAGPAPSTTDTSGSGQTPQPTTPGTTTGRPFASGPHTL